MISVQNFETLDLCKNFQKFLISVLTFEKLDLKQKKILISVEIFEKFDISKKFRK